MWTCLFMSECLCSIIPVCVTAVVPHFNLVIYVHAQYIPSLCSGCGSPSRLAYLPGWSLRVYGPCNYRAGLHRDGHSGRRATRGRLLQQRGSRGQHGGAGLPACVQVGHWEEHRHLPFCCGRLAHWYIHICEGNYRGVLIAV